MLSEQTNNGNELMPFAWVSISITAERLLIFKERFWFMEFVGSEIHSASEISEHSVYFNCVVMIDE